MRGRHIHAFTGLTVAVIIVGCSSAPRQPPPSAPHEVVGPARILVRFAGAGGSISRASMEQGLRKDFDAADLDQNGVLQPDEARGVNAARSAEDPSTSRMKDWNANGVIEFNEFALAPRSLFDQLDRDRDGVLTPDELEGPAAGFGGDGEGPSRGGRSGGRHGGSGRPGGG
jgi:hypothetical protein